MAALRSVGARQQRHRGCRGRRRKIATGLSLVKAAGTLDVVVAVDKAVQERAYELGATLAATLID